jgi:hypothetical protein
MGWDVDYEVQLKRSLTKDELSALSSHLERWSSRFSSECSGYELIPSVGAFPEGELGSIRFEVMREAAMQELAMDLIIRAAQRGKPPPSEPDELQRWLSKKTASRSHRAKLKGSTRLSFPTGFADLVVLVQALSELNEMLPVERSTLTDDYEFTSKTDICSIDLQKLSARRKSSAVKPRRKRTKNLDS